MPAADGAATPWVTSSEPASLGVGNIVVVDGQTFCVAQHNGDITPGTAQGLYFADARMLSRFEIRLDAMVLEPLDVSFDDAFTATIVTRLRPTHGAHQSDLLVVRRRDVGMGMRETIEVRNYGAERVACFVDIAVDVDFASLFEVKESRVNRSGSHSVIVGASELVYAWTDDDIERSARIAVTGDDVEVHPGRVHWRPEVDAQQRCTLCIEVTAAFGTTWVESLVPCGSSRTDHGPTGRASDWRAMAPTLGTADGRWSRIYERSVQDIGSLRLFDPDGRRKPVIAAGAPWFMALFGRDALIASWMTLMVSPDLAVGVLDALGELQGTDIVAATEEEPGRIMHELRFTASHDAGFSSGEAYYGSVDATPLYVMLLAEAARWGVPLSTLRPFLSHADSALAWIEDFGDRDGDGFVEYLRRHRRGLANQGWKDSFDGVRHADGAAAQAPIALCEVQGYVFAAYRARADLARWFDQPALVTRYEAKAAHLKRSFNEQFWVEDGQYFAVGLGPDRTGAGKAPIRSVTSNMGHCLWSGIVDDEKAPFVAAALMSEAMWTGFGIRTLSSTNPGFNPMSYHCGSVWPHDTAIAVGGLMRYGFEQEALRVVNGLLDASTSWDGRLPELFCGLSRDDIERPVSYPTSCSPQAWSSAAPLLLLRAMFGLDISVPDGHITVASRPLWPSALTLRSVPIGDGHVTITSDHTIEVSGLPPGLVLERRWDRSMTH